MTNMDVEESGPPQFKRQRLDNALEEIGAKGRTKLTGLKKEDKTRGLHFVYELMRRIYVLGHYNPLSASTDLIYDYSMANVAFSLHQAMRQAQNQSGKAKDKFFIQKNIMLNVHGRTTTIQMADLKQAYQEALTAAQLTLAKKDEWMGNVQTLISLLLLGYERMKEVRIMPTGLIIGKETVDNTTTTKMIDFTSLGIKPQHRQLCVGANWKPFLRGALAQSTGPLTQVALLATGKNDMYISKWAAAVERTFAFVPGIDAVVRVLRENQAKDLSEIIHKLALIAMIVGSREQNRISLPPIAVIRFLSKRVIYQPDKPSGSAELPAPVTRLEFDPERATLIDFSGTGAYRAYRDMCTSARTFTLNIPDEAASQQILFHSIFGTYVEDFGVLEFMSGSVGWLSRKELDPFFKYIKTTAAEEPTAVKFIPGPLRFYAKMANATQVKAASLTTRATNAHIQFAGFRRRKFTNEMAETLAQAKGAVAFTATVNGVVANLEVYLSHLRNTLGDKDYAAGTVKWRSFRELTNVDDGVEVEEAPEETGRIFWSN